MEALLDFSQPFNYQLFVQVVGAYQQTADYALKQKAADTLRQFQEAPESSRLCMEILSQERDTQDPMVRFFGFSLLELFLKRNWHIISSEQQRELCTYVMSFVDQCLSVDNIVRRKFLTIFTLIAIYTYPTSYSTFLADVLSMRATPLDQINSATILAAFLDDLRVRQDILSGQKMAIEQQLTIEIPQIMHYIVNLTQGACDGRNIFLLTILLKLLISLITFCDNITKTDNLVPLYKSITELLLKTLTLGETETFSLALKAMGHLFTVLKTPTDGLNSSMAVLFYQVIEVVAQMYKVDIAAKSGQGPLQQAPGFDPGTFPSSYSILPMQGAAGSIDQNPFFSSDMLASLSFFISSALDSCLDYIEELACDSIPPNSIDVTICLRQAATKTIHNEKLLDIHLFKYRYALQLLTAILVYERDTLGFVDTQLIEFVTRLAKKIQGRNLRKPTFKRMDVYTDIITAIQRFAVLNIPPPIDVLVYVDEYGNVMKKELEDSEQLNNFAVISKAIEATTRAIKTSTIMRDLLAELSKQFSAAIVNIIAWSLPAIARSIKSSDIPIVATISQLIDLSSILVEHNHKLCIAGAVVYICSQMPLFLDTKEKIFIVMLSKMLFFTSIPNEQLQEMSVRCFSLMIKNIKGTTFFDSTEFKAILRELMRVSMNLPASLIVILYESVSSRVSDTSRTFMEYVGPFLELLDGAFSQCSPDNIGAMGTISTVFSIFRGICEGVQGKVNGEVFASSYSHFMVRTVKLYVVLQNCLTSPDTPRDMHNMLCTVRRNISVFLESLLRVASYNHLRVWFLNMAVGTNVMLPDSNSVRVDTLKLIGDYKQYLTHEGVTGSGAGATIPLIGLVDVKFAAFVHTLFEQIAVLSSDADNDEIMGTYLDQVLVPLLSFLMAAGFTTHIELADVFISSVCRVLTTCSAYIKRQGDGFLRVFLEFVPPALRAVSESNVFYKHYKLCLDALSTLCEMLLMRPSLNFEIICILFADAIRLLNKGTAGKDYSVLSSWWTLLQKSGEPDMEAKVFRHISPLITPNMVSYFKSGLEECNEPVIRDLFVVLRMILWF